MYETVLVPVDGSDESRRATAEAVELTASEGTIHALAVVEELPMHRRSGKAQKFEDDKTAKRKQAEQATETVTERAESAGVNYETTVTDGVPAREITDFAAEIDADAIVVGKRHTAESAGEILGSTTERIINNATTTVVAVPAEE